MNVYPPAASGGSGSGWIASASAALASDVAMSVANTFYDGPSVSLAAGTWLVVATVMIHCTTATGKPTVRLWDGTTTYAEVEDARAPSTVGDYPMSVSALIVLGSTTTIKISAALVNLGTTPAIKANVPDNPASANKSSIIVAIRGA